MNKKGQAALEFLMTYGWAILVVLAAIGALAYFGVLSPSKFLPDKCMASTTGFGCVGKPVITNESIAFTLHNGIGEDIDSPIIALTGVTCANTFICEKGTLDCDVSDDLDSLPADGDVTISSTGCSGLQTITANYEITYTNTRSGLGESITITVQGKAQ